MLKDNTAKPKQVLSVSNSGFAFSNHFCHILLDTVHDPNGKQYKNLRIKNSTDKQIDFKFTNSLWKATDTNYEHNILLDFISIPCDNTNSLIDFFIKNGFIFRNSCEEYSLFSCNDLHSIIKRTQYLVQLIMELQKEKPNFEILLHNTVYLLISDPIIIYKDNTSMDVNNTQNNTIIYRSYTHEIYNCIIDYNNLSPTSTGFDYYDQDILCGAYTDFENSKKEFKDELKFSLTMNYLFRDNVTNKTRSQIKFFYKLLDISCISIVSLYEGVKFSKKIYLILNSFNDELKQELLNITKDVVKTELNYNISKVRANYNIDDLQASWQIPDLLTAIYFSIFFLNPHFEIIKKCANPTCDTFLSAVHSNTRKKYCSTRCANAVSQRNSRIRQRAPKNN